MKQKHDGILSDDNGTIDTEIDYVRKSEELENISNSIDANREANASRAGVFVIANQSGIARGFLTDDDLSAGREHLVDVLGKLHAPADAGHFCVYLPEFGRPSLQSCLPLSETRQRDVEGSKNRIQFSTCSS